MTAALAPMINSISDSEDIALAPDPIGAESLLRLKAPRPNYPAQIVAIVLYALGLTGILVFSIPRPETQTEEPLELVLAPAPAEEPPPPEEVIPEQPDEVPLPPETIEPVAPVQEQPKPLPKPAQVKKVEKKVDRKPIAPTNAARAPATSSAAAPSAPQNASLSAIASQIHARLQRAAANAYPESQAPRSARVGYRVSFDAAGTMISFSIVPSGNPAFDAVASRLGGRVGSISPPGKPVALSGSLTFSP